MIAIKTHRFLLAFLAVSLSVGFAQSTFADDAATDAEAQETAVKWQAPEHADVRTNVAQWLDEAEVSDDARKKVLAAWDEVPKDAESSDLLTQLADCIALGDDRAAELVKLCSQPRESVILPTFEWLADEETPSFVSANLRLLYGRWLVRHLLFDEAGEQFKDLQTDDVVDPAALLFYQSVVHHRLLEKQPGIATSGKLIEGEDQSPRRYVALARLIRDDLGTLKEDSLDHIARRMEDVERRLDLGRAGKTVRGVEDGVIESLDKMIEELEKQQQQQSSSSSSGQNIQSSKPAQDSQIMGGKGRGEVVKRGVGAKDGWGNLPPKQREEALQQIGREFPAHYRDVIEQYFRRLASEQD